MTDASLPKPSRPPPPALPEGWVAIWDEEYKRYYYANRVTRETQWEIPTASAAPRPPPTYNTSVPQQVPALSHVQQTQQVPVQHIQQVQGVQTVPVVQQVPVVQAVPVVQQVPVAVPVVHRRPASGLVTGMVVGSMIGGRRRRRR
ncbi:CIC11C00000005089 [Sungouiella intermedia]|uniref:CIC11C00000005089 n=1 Tax=Sungouiella intermedia TaxID=45354 RepID=A0A1L0BE71_9ASCO|nr:CIC11C00000005089 [[Candida] intermedia]